MTDKKMESLRRIMREALAKSREPDPHIVAKRVAQKLDHQELLDIAAYGLAEIAREQVRDSRNKHRIEGRPQREVFRDYVNDHWKLWENFSADDLLTLAAEGQS